MRDSLLLLHQEQAALYEQKFLSKTAMQPLYGRHSFCIEVDLDLSPAGIKSGRTQAFLSDPYIKIGDANTIELSTYVTRISLYEPHVVVKHAGPQIVVNTRFLNNLTKAVTYPSTYTNVMGKATHGDVIDCINAFLTEVANQHHLTYDPVPKPVIFTINNTPGYVYNKRDKSL